MVMQMWKDMFERIITCHCSNIVARKVQHTVDLSAQIMGELDLSSIDLISNIDSSYAKRGKNNNV